MKLSLFTGSAPEWTPAELAGRAAAQGWDGLEWRIADPKPAASPGFWAGNLATYPMSDIEQWADEMQRLPRDAGIALSGLAPYVQLSDHENADRVLAVAASTGARRVRFTTPKPAEGEAYARLFERTRGDLEALERTAKAHGAQVVIQIHHGTITPNSSAARRLVDGLDPSAIGVMHDLGNTTIEGREGLLSYNIALEILGEYLAHIHIKNAVWIADGASPNGATRWKWAWAGLREGMGDVDAYFRALKAVGYDGWVTLENFTTSEPLADRLASDLAFMRAAARAAGYE